MITIAELINEQTMFNGGRNKRCLTYNELVHFLKKLRNITETGEYLRINLFYVNGMLQRQIEFDEAVFYLEIRSYISQEDKNKYYTSIQENSFCKSRKYNKKDIEVRYPLCLEGDTNEFKQQLDVYFTYLNTVLPSLYEEAIKLLEVSMEFLPFGNFCFEIYGE